MDDCPFMTLLQDGWTPLLFACSGGHKEVVEILIKHGAELDMKNKVLSLLCVES